MFNKNTASIVIIVSIFFYTIINFNKAKEHIEVFNDNEYVVPLGNIVGIKGDCKGLLVLGYEDEDKIYVGGIQVGDTIIKINDIEVNDEKEVNEILEKITAKEVSIQYIRNNEIIKENIKLKKENGKNKLGLWVRDKISGVGTLTFYNPTDDKFYGIGHSIKDEDTDKIINIREGIVYKPNDIEIYKSSKKNIGKIDVDISSKIEIGNFKENNKYGIRGCLEKNRNKYDYLLKIGKKEDVKLGKATIFFEDINKNIKSYDIEIKKILNDDKYADKDMEIEVVDPNLLEYTGGIVRGMSGAPIIQNNKIIGAITHVFSDNNKKGYGIFLNQMIE